MNNVVYLITSKGCYACSIMKNIIEQVFKNKSDIKFVVLDISEVPDWIKNTISINDVPLTVFTVNKTVLYTITGSCTANKFNKVLDLLKL